MAEIDITAEPIMQKDEVTQIELEVLRAQVRSIRDLAEHLRPHAPITAGLIDWALEDPDA